jgi:hypothetical protein
VTLIQSLGATQWFGIRLPVMMGVTFAAVAPMVAIANANPGAAGAQLLFGSIIGAGIISILIAPLVSRMLRFFPPVVTGTIIAVIGISLMRVGINWIFGNPFGPTAPNIIDPVHAKWLADVTLARLRACRRCPRASRSCPPCPTRSTPSSRASASRRWCWCSILLIVKFAKGFIANISVLLGIVIGAVAATVMGLMTFEKVGKAPWVDVVMPFAFGMPQFDPILILTMTLVMIVVMIESTGMFLALGEMTDRKIDQQDLARGLRTDGLGTLIGGIFNTFPYTSFSQNVGWWRSPASEPFRLRRRRRDPDRAGPVAQDGGAGRVAAHRGAGRCRPRDVRHGGRHRHPHPVGRGLQGQPPQRDDRGHCRRRRHDPADRAELQAVDAARHPSADRLRHPAVLRSPRCAEPVLHTGRARTRPP